MTELEIETDILGELKVLIDMLWRAQTEDSLKYFSIG
jgi:fumarate hydratase class II